MKDFDFDELDKAVSSVLQKQTGDVVTTPSTQIGQQLSVSDAVMTPSASTESSQHSSYESSQIVSNQSTPKEDTDKPLDDPAPATTFHELHQNSTKSQPSQTPDTTANSEITSDANADTTNYDDLTDESNAKSTTSSDSITQNSESSQTVIAQPVKPQTIDGSGDLKRSETVSAETSNTPVLKQPAPRPAMPSRRGRFMDVVHPSADMQSQTKPVGSPKRTGLIVTPSASFAVTQPASGAQNLDASSVHETESVDDTAKGDQTTSDAGTKSSTSDNSQNSTDSSTDSQDTNTEQTTSQVERSTPPFIEGASESVEKRPLGGYAKSAQDDSVEPVDTESNGSDEVTSKEGQPAATDSFSPVSIPEEYNKELIAVENQQVSTSEQDDSQTITAKNENESETFVASSSSEKPSESQDVADTGEHAIFDTSSYHQPIVSGAKPTAKRHVVFWALLILALFIGGCALGALYFLSLN